MKYERVRFEGIYHNRNYSIQSCHVIIKAVPDSASGDVYACVMWSRFPTWYDMWRGAKPRDWWEFSFNNKDAALSAASVIGQGESRVKPGYYDGYILTANTADEATKIINCLYPSIQLRAEEISIDEAAIHEGVECSMG